MSDLIKESVPRFKRRLGDYLLQGSNNTLVVLGTDRPSDPDSGLQESGAGTIYAVAGRQGQDPDFSQDKSFLYVSAKTEVDKNLGTSTIESIEATGAAVIIKTEHGRIICRKDLKIVCGDSSYLAIKSDELVAEAKTIRLGKNADQSVIRGSLYRREEEKKNTQVVSALQSASKAVQIAATAMNTAGGDVTFSGLASTAAAGVVSAGAALQTAAQALSKVAEAYQNFESSRGSYLSTVSKTL